jgi:hypothetical protein
MASNKSFLEGIRDVRKELANATDEEVVKWLVRAKIIRDRKPDGTWTTGV